MLVPSSLPHPSAGGFHLISPAMPDGQVGDWGLSLDDGSRIHLHEFADGRLIAHRDVFDPDRGIGHAIAHVIAETPLGAAVAVLGLVLMLNGVARA